MYSERVVRFYKDRDMKEIERRQLLKKQTLDEVIANLKNKKVTKKSFPHGVFASLSADTSLLLDSTASVLLLIDSIFVNLEECDSINFMIEALDRISQKPISKVVEYQFFIFILEQNIKCIKEIAISLDLRDLLSTLLNECRDIYIEAVREGVLDESKLKKARHNSFSLKKKWLMNWKKIENRIDDHNNKEIVNELRVLNRALDSAESSLVRRFSSDLDTSVFNNVKCSELNGSNREDIYKTYSRELLQLIK